MHRPQRPLVSSQVIALLIPAEIVLNCRTAEKRIVWILFFKRRILISLTWCIYKMQIKYILNYLTPGLGLFRLKTTLIMWSGRELCQSLSPPNLSAFDSFDIKSVLCLNWLFKSSTPSSKVRGVLFSVILNIVKWIKSSSMKMRWFLWDEESSSHKNQMLKSWWDLRHYSTFVLPVIKY